MKKNLQYVWCIGLGGVGVSAIAKFFLQQGVTVSGSDLVRSPLVEDIISLGGAYYSKHDEAHITSDIDLVVYSDDCGPDNPERQAADRLGLLTQNFSETLGHIMSGYRQRLAVAGTNGKSTTTALTGLLLAGAGLDPTVFVGSRVSQFGGNLRLGGADVFVAEADEYRDHFLNLQPTIATITNIELDHVNYFHDLSQVVASFQKFVQRVDDAGHIVINIDDPTLKKDFSKHPRIVTFGQADSADLRFAKIVRRSGQQTFDLWWHNQPLGNFTLHIPGLMNIYNVAAAVATTLTAGADPKTFKKTIADFRGVWRRFEIVSGPSSPVTIVNDYAHHPTAVRGTLAGAKDFFPGRRIIAVFQPHHHNRLTVLFGDFTSAFASADQVIIAEVYAVPGRSPEVADNKTGKDLAAAVASRGQAVTYAASPAITAEQIQRLANPGDVVIIMGAGDIWSIAQPLAKYYGDKT